MSLCPEAEYRASLTDAEFWEHVFHGDDGPDDYDPADDAGAPRPDDPVLVLNPCPVCGTWYQACGYDAEGLPMVHVSEAENDR